MERLRARLIDHYAQHYARVNTSVEPNTLSSRERRRLDLMFGALLDSVPEGGRILDVGCGTGRLLHWLGQRGSVVPVGVDLSAGQVGVARSGVSGAEVHCDDGLRYMLAHPDEFEAVFCFDILEHTRDKDTCLEWMEAVLQSLRLGGFAVCRVPNAANMTGLYSRYMDLTHEIVFTRTSIMQLLCAAGFSHVSIIPIQAAHLSGRIRLRLEWLFHKGAFLLCGRGGEHIFTSNLYVIGYRR